MSKKQNDSKLSVSMSDMSQARLGQDSSKLHNSATAANFSQRPRTNSESNIRLSKVRQKPKESAYQELNTQFATFFSFLKKFTKHSKSMSID